jgi:hypothetical protein
MNKITRMSQIAVLSQIAMLAGFVAPSHATPAIAPVTPTPPAIQPSPAAALVILTPTPNAIVDVGATNITIQSPLDGQVDLQVNGQPVSASLIGRTERNSQTKQITQTWFGVPLQDGDNTITATLSVNGNVTATSALPVQVRGEIKRLKLSTAETRIPADGRSTVTINGELLDAKGNRSNRDALVTLTANAGEFVAADADTAQPGFQVKATQGQFSTPLKSGIEALPVRIQAKTANIDAFTQVQFETSLRPSLTTGVIDLRIGRRGTDYYDSFRQYLPADRDYNYKLNAKGAAFATGKVGDWLLTAAYNSDRALNKNCDRTTRLFRDTQFCEQNYPVYGDASKTEVLTPSTDSVYFKLEQSAPGTIGTNYAMWGDYRTEEFATTAQQFTATTRPLHGFKANYHIGNLQATAMYGNNLQGFQRDSLSPDGTSGYYFLARRLLIGGSENVFLELEELNRPGTIVDRQQLSRGQDYEIDYDRGTILFKQPILRTNIDKSGQVLVRKIVATYQYESSDQKNSLYAGRLRYHLSKESGKESWIGGTYLREDRGTRDFEIYGADAIYNFGTGNIVAEYAHASNRSDILGLVSGSAYRVEANATIAPGVQTRAYYRKAETGFANDATISFVPGQTRYGAGVQAKVGATTDLRLQYDHEDNVGIAPRQLDNLTDIFTPRTTAVPGAKVDNSLTTITAGVQQKIGDGNLAIDYLHRDRTDRLYQTASNRSDQLRSNLTYPLSKKLTLQALNETTLSAKTDAVASDRTALGLDWNFMPGLSLQFGQQWFTRGQSAGQAITSLNLNGEYKLGADTTLTGRYGIVGGASPWTTQGALGLNQGVTIAPGLRADLAYEHLFGGYLNRTNAGQQFSQPFTSGQSASALGFGGGDTYSVGLEYTGSKEFQASARYQHRSSSSGTNTVLSASALGKLSPAITAIARYQKTGTANQQLDLGATSDLKIGLAYREPKDDRFNALLRYEYRKNPSTIPDSILFGAGSGSREHLLALEAVYAPNWRWEFYGKYALRNSRTYLATDQVGKGTISLAQIRAMYHLDYSWDLVGEARWISQPTADYTELGWLAEVGYTVTPNLRLAVGYSFGKVDDRDFSGSRSAGGVYFGLSVKLNDLLSDFGRQKPSPKPDTVAQVKP